MDLDVASAARCSNGEPQTFNKSLKLSARIGNLVNSPIDISVRERKVIGRTFYSTEACTFDENAFGISSAATEEKVGVLLLNLGGPDTLEDVQPFLFNLFADPVCILTLAPPLDYFGFCPIWICSY